MKLTLCLLLLLAALPAMAGNKGLLILQDTDWKAIEAQRQKLPNPNLYLVLKCGDSADCMAEQLHPFIAENDITDLVLVASKASKLALVNALAAKGEPLPLLLHAREVEGRDGRTK